MRWLLLCCCAIAPLAQLPAEQDEALDRVIRYVDDEIITLYDVVVRFQEWQAIQRRTGGQVARTLPEQLAKLEEFTEDITDDILLQQHAEQLEVVIDERPIRREIRDRARVTNQPQMLLAAVDLLEREVERARIDAVLGFYQQAAVHVSPAELERAYRERRDEFVKPARRHLLRIVRRPTPEAEREEITQRLLEIFRAAQADPAPAIQDLVTPELRRAYVDARADPAEQRAILVDLARQVVAAAPADPASQTAELVAAAEAAVARTASIADEEEVRAQLQAAREGILALPPAERGAAFKDLARELSQGPRGEGGGDLGWSESGMLGEPYESAVAEVPEGGVSEVFAAGNSLVLMFVLERDAARAESLAEVNAKLRRVLENEQREAVRERLVANLRARASIRDLAPLSASELTFDGGMTLDEVATEVDGAAPAQR